VLVHVLWTGPVIEQKKGEPHWVPGDPVPLFFGE
jgi:hypothetical protein